MFFSSHRKLSPTGKLRSYALGDALGDSPLFLRGAQGSSCRLRGGNPCGDPRLALLIYKELLQSLGGSYFLDVRGVMPLQSVETLEGLEKTLEILRQQLSEIEQGQVSVRIDEKEYPKIIISVSSVKGQDLFWGAVIAASSENGMIASVRDGVDLLLNLDNGGAGGEQ